MRLTTQRTQTCLWTALALVLLAPLSAWSASSKALEVNVSTSGLTFASQGPNNGILVRVSGVQGLVTFEKSYEGSARPSLSTKDIAGERRNLPDGLYKWEATLSPKGITAVFDRNVGRGPAQIEEYLKNGNNLVAPEEDVSPGTITNTDQFRVSGAFTVLNGSIVDPNAVEPDAGPDTDQE